MLLNYPKVFNALLLFLLANSVFGQTWISRQGGVNNDETSDVVATSTGVVSVGYFSTLAHFDASAQLVSSGLTDISIVKYQSGGGVAWAKKAGGSGSDRGLAIATDAGNNLYITGYYTGSATFGSISLTANSNSQDIFIAKYDNTGNCLWAKSAGSAGGSDIGYGIATDNNGNVLVTGQFSGTADFDGTSITSSSGVSNIFVAKYGSDGSVIWVKAGTSSATCRGLGITSDGSGNVAVTGQISADLTFDNTSANNAQNAIFVTKFDASGAEQWTRILSGGSQGISYDITSDNSNDLIIAGGFQGNLSMVNPSYNFNANYSNSAFLTKFSPAGSILWTAAASSQNAVQGRNLVIYGTSVYLYGSFECTLTDYADEYGSGTFNSIGYQDCFMSSFNLADGTFNWARNFGGHKDDIPKGLTVSSTGTLYYSGSFIDDIEFACIQASGYGTGMYNNAGPNTAFSNYCSDPNYGKFSRTTTSGTQETSDGFVTSGMSTDRDPYDYWYRPGSGCDRSRPSACIDNGNVTYEYDCNSSDTISTCGTVILVAKSHTARLDTTIGRIGPYWSYLWSTGATTREISAGTTGWYSVTLTSEDGCISISDSVYVDIRPSPDPPLISDNQGINDSTANPLTITICAPSDVVLTGFPNGSGDYNTWSGPGITPPTGTSISAPVTGPYQYVVSNQYGCTSATSVYVQILQPQEPDSIVPGIYFAQGISDSITLCANNPLNAIVFDSLLNQNPPNPLGHGVIHWQVHYGSHTNSYFSNTVSMTGVPDSSYMYYFDVHITINPPNFCGGDTLHFEVADSIYVHWSPIPQANLTLQNVPSSICGGDTLVINYNATGNVTWEGPGIISYNNSQLLIDQSGTYDATVVDSNAFGCSSTGSAEITISDAQNPSMQSLPGNALICPQDSVLLQSTTGLSYQWQGPNGVINSNGNDLYVQSPGQWYCEVEVAPGCYLVTNTIEVTQYATPQLVTTGSNVLCEGDTVQVQAYANDGADLNWLAPLSGGDSIQFITQPGVYFCQVSSCGITTLDSIEIAPSNLQVSVNPEGSLTPCSGDSVLLVAQSNGSSLIWNPGNSQNDSLYVTQSGNYHVNASDTLGCSATSQNLSVIFQPPVTAPPGDTSLVCYGQSFQYNLLPNENYIWFSDTGLTDTITTGNFITSPLYADTVFYALRLVNGCLSNEGDVPVYVQMLPNAPNLSSNSPVCLFQPLNLKADSSDATNYRWILPYGSVADGNPLTLYPSDSANYTGTYFCYGLIQGCIGDTAQISIQIFNPIQINLPPDTTFCVQEPLVFSPSGNFSQLVWNNQDTAMTYTLQQGGQVFVQALDEHNCSSNATGIYESVDCNLIIPNIFTPDGDGINDTWKVKTGPLFYVQLEIFNRWGKKIYESANEPVEWDGTNMNDGKKVSDGTYFYILKGMTYDQRIFDDHGTITVITHQ